MKRKIPLWQKEVFTSGEAAKICRVSLNTIIRCFDNGLLQGYKIPGSNFRRIPRSALLKFIKEQSLDIDLALFNKPKIREISFFTDDDTLFSRLVAILNERADVTKIQSTFEAGLNHAYGHTLVLDSRTIDLAILLGILGSIQNSRKNDRDSLRTLLFVQNGNQNENLLSNSGFPIIRCPEDFNQEKIMEALSN